MEPRRPKNIDRIRGTDPPELSPPVARLVGMRVASFDEGVAVLELDADERHANTMGTVHGGILCDLADLAMGVACYTTLEEGESFTTIELKVNFTKPVWKGRLTARGEVKNAGRTVVLLQCDVCDDKGSLVAFATSTCLVLRGDAARGR